MKKFKKILIVDDSPTARAMHSDFFSELGFKISEAENGSEALKKAQKELPDIVLSDVLMPILDGFGLCIELKKNNLTADIPVILLSGTYVQKEDRDFGMAIGAYAYLQKPLPKDRIKAILANIFRDPADKLSVRQNNISMEKLNEYQSSLYKKYNTLLIKKMEIQVEKYNLHQNQLERILNFSTTIQETIEDEYFIDNVLETIKQYTSASAFAFYLKQHDSPDLFMEKSSSVPDFFRESLSTVEIGYSFAGKCFAQEKILEFVTEQFTSSTMKAIYLKHGIKKILAIPLTYCDGIKGSIVLLFTDDDNLTTSQLNNLSSIAKITAHSISRRRLDILIKESRRKYRSVFDNAADPVYAVDLNYNITSINKKLANQFDSFPGKITGKKCYQILQMTDKPCEKCPVKNKKDHAIIPFNGCETLLRKTNMPDENGVTNNHLIHLLDVKKIKDLLK